MKRAPSRNWTLAWDGPLLIPSLSMDKLRSRGPLVLTVPDPGVSLGMALAPLISNGNWGSPLLARRSAGGVRFERASEWAASARDASTVTLGPTMTSWSRSRPPPLGTVKTRFSRTTSRPRVQNRLRRAHAASAHLGEGARAVDARGGSSRS